MKITRENYREHLQSLDEMINSGYDEYIEQASDIISGVSEKIDTYLKFTKGISDIQKWVEENRVIYGRKFSYSDALVNMMLGKKDTKVTSAPRPYLRQYLNDKCKDKTVIKCRQSEFTENEINENIYLCISRPYTNVRHIFPTAGVAGKIAREKISPAIEKSPNILKDLKKPYNLTSKGFQNGSFYTIDSSWTDFQGRGPSSDKITFDEYESQNPHIEDIYSESTSHSELALKTRISTPKFPNSGIDGAFKKGCEYEWHFTCKKCKKEQLLEFPNNIIHFFEAKGEVDVQSEAYQKQLDKVYIGCRYCGEYVDRVSGHYIKTSRWIPKKPHLITQRASYRVTYMMLPWKTGKEILYKYHTFKFLHQFYNEICGYAYISPEAQITRDIFEQCIDNSLVNSYQKLGMATNVSVGIDWGNISWVVVRANGFLPNKRQSKIIYVERIDSNSLIAHGHTDAQTSHVKRVIDICEFFNAKIIINDANGIGVDRNSTITRRFPTRAYGCFYDTDEHKKQKHKENLIQPRWSDSNHTVTVSRVSTFKLLIQEYESQKITIPRIDQNIEEFIQHHTALVVERYEDEDTHAIFEVIGKTGPDHYGHADNYAKIGFDRLVNNDARTSAGVINSHDDGDEEILKQLSNATHSLLG